MTTSVVAEEIHADGISTKSERGGGLSHPAGSGTEDIVAGRHLEDDAERVLVQPRRGKAFSSWPHLLA